jgi:hypothetical protein
VPHEVLHFNVITDLSESGGFAAGQVFKTLIIALPDHPADRRDHVGLGWASVTTAINSTGQANALCPVMCRPTMSDWISAVPS